MIGILIADRINSFNQPRQSNHENNNLIKHFIIVRVQFGILVLIKIINQEWFHYMDNRLISCVPVDKTIQNNYNTDCEKGNTV